MLPIRSLLCGLALLTSSAIIPVHAQNQPAAGQQARPAQTQPTGQIAMPPPEAMIVMIRSTVVALGHANMTNNYSVLNALGSQNFRKSNNVNQLSKSFEPFRSNKIDLAPVVYLTPQLSQQPTIENGRLRMVGYFPSQPMRVNFDLMFEPSEGIWKLFGIGVNLVPASQAAVAPMTRQQQPGQGQPLTR